MEAGREKLNINKSLPVQSFCHLALHTYDFTAQRAAKRPDDWQFRRPPPPPKFREKPDNVMKLLDSQNSNRGFSTLVFILLFGS